MRQVRYLQATLPPISNQPKIFYLNPCASSCLHYHIVMADVWCLNSRNPPLFSSSSLASISPPPRCNPPLLFSSFFCYEFSTSTLSLCFLQRLFTFPVSTFIVCLDWGRGRRSRADLVQNLLIFSLHYSTPLHSPSFLLPSKQAIKLLFKNVKHDWVMLGTYKLSQLLLQLVMW